MENDQFSPPKIANDASTTQLKPKPNIIFPVTEVLAGASILISFIVLMLVIQNSNSSNTHYKNIQNKIDKLEANNKSNKSNNEDKINKDGYQAVFISNGQVYFGKISSITDTQIVLTKIYYLKNDTELTQQNVNNLADNTNVSLVKLGDELHGPEDIMYIERKDTSFWENLKNESQVVKAIIEFETSKSNNL